MIIGVGVGQQYLRRKPGKPLPLINLPVVGNNPYFTGFATANNAGGQQGATYQNIYTADKDTPNVISVFGNFYNSNNGLNDIFVRVGIEIPLNSGKWYQGIFEVGARDGGKQVVIPPGEFAKHKPIPVAVTKGTQIGVQVNVSVQNVGEKWPTGYVNVKYAPGTTDYTMTTIPGNTYSQAYSPVAVIGMSADNNQGVAIGDSILTGSNDSAGAVRGFFVMALGNERAYTRLSLPGETLQTFWGATFNGAIPTIGTTGTARRKLLEGHKWALIEYGNNDIFNTRLTLTQMQNLFALTVNEMRRLGISKIFATTITVRTTSTDSFATVDGQTPVKANGVYDVWLAYNAWLMTKPLGINGVFDVASKVLTQNSSGDWVFIPACLLPDGAQGIHPSTQGHTQMATAIDLGMLV